MSFNFSRKYALLDTNILSQMAKTRESIHYKPIFNFLHENNCDLWITDMTKFEFLSYSTNSEDYKKMARYVARFPSLPIQSDTISEAAKLSSMYKTTNPNINPQQISFVDLIHAVMLLKYKDKAFIVTSDVNDYPSFLFDMPKHQAIELKESTYFIAFKTFNEDKLTALKNNFHRSGKRSE